MAKYIVGGILIILVAGSGYYLLSGKRNSSAPAPVVQQPATETYATSTFSITYPEGYTADASYIYDQVNPKKPISGVRFTIPGSMATGTNLSSDTYLSVEWLPRAKKCTGDIYLAANVRPHTETLASTTYSVATSSGAAAGNIYEESVYALPGTSPCIAVRYYIHSTNMGNYPAQGEPGAVREFDRAALLAAFDTIRASLMLGTPAPAPTTTP